ncbi:iron-containing redox enzyme family protein [Limnobacter humi]|uniref:Iron-containing redox enzyme family protein n=1 Tax=Limnobacter humi TaxID=1778671 RepID=A0ABT1WJM1_9BURK|nr:iron-containing redox enzyme family protein [Limnobacter humi]MCQ8897709.1 iron-containing redox enzyme family protein [Limnobacter humi]
MTSFFQQLQRETEPSRQALVSTPIIQEALRGEVTRQQYIAFLSQAYHHVRHTVPLLMACGSRLGSGHEFLKKAIAEYIEEEYGHEQWILDDIAAAGGNPEQVKNSQPHISTAAMVAYAYHQIDRRNPVGFFGMVHVLEGTSTALATLAAEKIQTNLGLPPNAFSYLTSHGSLDLEHVKFFENLVNQLTLADDHQAVIDTAHAMYHLYGNLFRSLPQSDSHALFDEALTAH